MSGSVPLTGVSAVNVRGEVALIIPPLHPAAPPTSVLQSANRLVVMSGERPVSVRGYSDRAADAAQRKRRALVLEVDEASETVVRATDVAVEAER